MSTAGSPVEGRVDAARRTRRTRGRVSILLQVGLVLCFLSLLYLLPLGSPLLGVGLLAFAAAHVAIDGFTEGWDDWRRSHALVSFAIGAAVGLTWLVIDAFLVALAHADPASPGLALSLAGGTWQMAVWVRGMPYEGDGDV